MDATPYRNRGEAGRRLAEALGGLDLRDPVVLGVPRGGVPVARQVAESVGGELDVVVVRKVGAPGNPELGLGAVGPEGEPYVDHGLVAQLRVGAEYLSDEVERQRSEARRRVDAYRGGRPAPEVAGRDVLVVDDGIATGGTVAAAARLLGAREPRRLILAVPVAPAEGLQRLRAEYDEVVCPMVPEPFYAVGQWYRDFHQVTDDEVRELLRGDQAA